MTRDQTQKFCDVILDLKEPFTLEDITKKFAYYIFNKKHLKAHHVEEFKKTLNKLIELNFLSYNNGIYQVKEKRRNNGKV